MSERQISVTLPWSAWCVVTTHLRRGIYDEVVGVLLPIYQQVESEPKYEAAVKGMTKRLLGSGPEAVSAQVPPRPTGRRLANCVRKFLHWST
jgi:hypothetical protein